MDGVFPIGTRRNQFRPDDGKGLWSEYQRSGKRTRERKPISRSLEKKAPADCEKTESPMGRDPIADGEQGAHNRREMIKRWGDQKWAAHRERSV
jgi:hypothetical protein